MSSVPNTITRAELLADPAPKCANCKHMAIIRAGRPPHPSTWKLFSFKPEAEEQGPVVRGKGACIEPSVAAAYPQLFYVTDMALCSLWERKE